MRVRFWGARGSLPCSLKSEDVKRKVLRILELAQEHDLSDAEVLSGFVEKQLPFALRGSCGGNTSCVEIQNGREYILCDAGTGLRDFGNVFMKQSKRFPATFHLFISHLHWDHIQGFPFFTPAYVPGNTINIYGCHHNLQEAFIRQQEPPFFPVPFSGLGAQINFFVLSPDKEHDLAGFRVRIIEQDHPGKSYGYSFSQEGKKIVYSTDSEHKEGVKGSPFIDFFKDADLLIFDAQYTFAEADITKRDWGHSSNLIGVELATMAGVKHLVIFHTEPTLDDDALERILNETREYSLFHAGERAPEVSMAFDGLEIEV